MPIKTVIFDLDGVLVDAREFHYEALNNALAKFDYTITRDEHLSTYDGLPTSKKLIMLTDKKGLSPDIYSRIWEEKQNETFRILRNLSPDFRIIDILKKLKEEGYKIVVCSNSIRESTKLMLLKKGFLEYVDFFLSNQEVNHPKPSPEIYLRAMIKLGLKPNECLIVEDSHIGRKAAIDSGGHLFPVENSSGVVYEKIKIKINEIDGSEKHKTNSIKWQDKKMNIVIPLAGEGRPFQKAGYTFPKPLIEVKGKPMIQLIVENLNTEGNFIFLVKKEHDEKYNLKHFLNLIAPGCKIIVLDGKTNGAACTVLLAKEHINNDSPLVIANSDQFIQWNSNEFFYSMAADECEGGIVTFKSTHPKWSYVRLGRDGFIKEVAEKKPISNDATAGIYFFKKGSDFVKSAEKMINNSLHINGEYYVCPTYNELIKEGKKIRSFDVKKVWGLDAPEYLEVFLKEYSD